MKPRFSFIMILAFAVSLLCSVATLQSQDAKYAIGDKGPAGGWIFYDKGNDTDGWRYLEAASEDISESIGWYHRLYIDMKPTWPGIGKGRYNTELIVKTYGDGKYAAKICADYKGGGKNDWFLPSKDELELMLKNLSKNGIGGFTGTDYWSSSEDMNHIAWIKGGYAGNRNTSLADERRKRVRPIRMF
ncbi:MAG TPA: hypothetical protein PKK43_06620 [Spirochaetota bacterium]|nr:hypothetical protein [Spirochaetota bacterium]